MRLIKRICIALLVVSAVTSCSKEESPDYKNFVSKDFVVTYQTSYINNLLDLASGTYPELNDLKPYISLNVDIYKVVYKTEVDGKEVNASGLLCVPSESGDYPLFSFQNGTNTMNDFAPSENVTYPAYQFVEIIASMGYVVVIPDYPGFGESSDIAHPYLIKEPTVRSVIDMLYAVKEMVPEDFPDLTIKDELYLMGYSQGGWATLALHKAMEQSYFVDYYLKGSVCGAGPYNLNLIFERMAGIETYPMPVYLGYIINAFSVYNQFTNPVSDILKEPYATLLPDLYKGTLSSDQINSQLTTSVSGLFTSGFLSGFTTDEKYATVRSSLTDNSIASWNTSIPLFLIHGGGDTSVDPQSTENIYNDMIQSGTSAQIIKKEILPGLDHGDAVIPAMIKGVQFIISLQ
jgi:pimeloyl-ACP methyl ester carboxylesterase